MIRRFLASLVLKKAFTLIELLVTMTIIMMLAGMLFPALSRAREEGRRTVCMSNVRQLIFAAVMYANNNYEYYPPLQQGGGFGSSVILWFGVEQPDGTYKPEGSFLYPYLPNGEIRWCPSFKKHASTGIYGNATGGYGYNDQYIGTSAFLDGNYTIVRPAKIGWIRKTDETIIFADCAYWDMVSKKIEEKYKLSAPCYEKYGGRYDANIHFRHNKKANIGFCDGHVESRFWDYPGTLAHGGDTSQYGLGFLSPVPVPNGTVPEDKRKLVNAYFDRD